MKSAQAVGARRGPSAAARTSPSRGTPRCPARAARARAARTPGRRCRSSRPASRPARARAMNAGAAADLQVLGQDVRRVRPAVRPEVLAARALRQLGEVLGQLLLGVAPGEVGVRLREAELGQPVHHLRPRERLGQEDHVRDASRLTSRDRPLPERERLGVRVVDAEDAHALRRSRTSKTLVELVPQRRASRRVSKSNG